ncbi:MAG TPA: carboxypeptidase-like regulatory domain-containing protein, partial [Prolixibacteraceae bacterium]|nr:carboxypeptidase-like regulatory domain-containing protein [Prolixibacteraceae bacterium]
MKKNHAYWRGHDAPPISKLLMVMNFVAVFVFACTMTVSAGVYSQDKKVTLSLTGVKFTKLFRAIEQSTGYRFTYSNDILPRNHSITIDVKAMPVSELLNNTLEKEGLKYRFIEAAGIFVISKNEAAVTGVEIPVNKVISGKVVNDKGEPLSGATVQVKGGTKAVSTAADGSFIIEVSDDVKTLIISYVGFGVQEVNIEKETIINVVLKADASGLNDVVVVGYGTARKKDLTGSVSSITSKDFTQGLVTNPMDQIQGKVPGLVITRADGDPNSEVILRLRGQTSLSGGQSPLLVLDGVILDDVSQISNILPGDIISYDVLKDASATAIYGSRGANGVIIINTRKGRSGRMQVDYAGFASVAKVARTPSLLSTPEFYTEAEKLGVDPSTYDSYNSGAGVTNDWVN